ncbi:MAG: amidohydrolase family protein [Acidobacteriota bacterium]|jgi:predicted TIM-barrel fold metal-dependent hydrolase|nr:amidohydrolase family protein [Acidobacteriota bacterium]
MIFDFHVHLYPDALAAKAVAHLSARFGNPPAFDGSVRGAREDMGRSGISASLNLPVATKPEQAASINEWAAQVNAAAEGVYSLATVHPDDPDMGRTLSGIARAGFRGIKLHPEYQAFSLDDPRVAPVWDECERLGLFVFLHAGGERVFQPPYRTSPATIARLLGDHPGLTVVAAHLGGFQMWDEAEELLAGKDVYLDLSHTFFWMPDEQIVRFVGKHGAERILFGSDAPWQSPAEVLAAFLRQPFSERDREAMLWGNAAGLMGLR